MSVFRARSRVEDKSESGKKNARERGLDDAVADSGSEIDKDALWSEVGPRKAVGARFGWVSKGQGKSSRGEGRVRQREG